MFFFLFDSKITYNVKTILFLLLIYILAVSLILIGDSFSLGGYLYLIAFSIIASVWRGTKSAVITIILNVITMSVIGFLCYNKYISISTFDSYSILKWITLGSNLFLVNVLSSISVGLLLDGLDGTIKNTIKLKNELSEEGIKLKEAKQKAEDADKLKTAFLANMSHELKTPLNAIIGFSNVIVDDEMTDIEEIYKFQKIISKSGDMLLELINDILDISVIESGQLKVLKKRVLLKDIITEVSHTFDEKIIAGFKKDIVFRIEDYLKDDKFEILTDPMRLKQIINNLVKNAFKFTDAGEIVFSFKQTDDKKYLLFKVQDTGIGIPSEKLHLIFNRFSKLEESSNNIIKGTGLGLTISKEIVAKLGGEIWVESVHGKGSTFYFTLRVS